MSDSLRYQFMRRVRGNITPINLTTTGTVVIRASPNRVVLVLGHYTNDIVRWQPTGIDFPYLFVNIGPNGPAITIDWWTHGDLVQRPWTCSITIGTAAISAWEGFLTPEDWVEMDRLARTWDVRR